MGVFHTYKQYLLNRTSMNFAIFVKAIVCLFFACFSFILFTHSIRFGGSFTQVQNITCLLLTSSKITSSSLATYKSVSEKKAYECVKQANLMNEIRLAHGGWRFRLLVDMFLACDFQEIYNAVIHAIIIRFSTDVFCRWRAISAYLSFKRRFAGYSSGDITLISFFSQ